MVSVVVSVFSLNLPKSQTPSSHTHHPAPKSKHKSTPFHTFSLGIQNGIPFLAGNPSKIGGWPKKYRENPGVFKGFPCVAKIQGFPSCFATLLSCNLSRVFNYRRSPYRFAPAG